MGILNLTPDSFSGPGYLHDPGRAIEAGRRMIAEGAAILDIGGESTRPGAEPVAPAEECRRVLPVIAGLAGAGVPISVDTRNAETMARALDAGAAIINDVSALQHDPAAAPLIASRRCPVILMHMRGTPQTMNRLARYEDVGAEVLAELAGRVEAAEAAGIARELIAVDPGFGFAKNAAHSRELLSRLSLFVNLQCPIIAGMSRKRFVGEMAGVAEAQARGPASLAAGLAALSQGATVLRVHDVASTVQTIRVWKALAE
jgi:dihydropteroate synthase